jgi:hypothetical protein
MAGNWGTALSTYRDALQVVSQFEAGCDVPQYDWIAVRERTGISARMAKWTAAYPASVNKATRQQIVRLEESASIENALVEGAGRELNKTDPRLSPQSGFNRLIAVLRLIASPTLLPAAESH